MQNQPQTPPFLMRRIFLDSLILGDIASHAHAQDLLQELRGDLAAGEITRAEFEGAVKRQPSSPKNARRLSVLLC
jgi:hypothetical protein